MAEAVDEEEGVRVALNEILRSAAKDAEIGEAGGDAETGGHVQSFVFDSWRDRSDRGLLDGVDELVQVALDAAEGGIDGKSPGDVAGVGVVLSTGVDEHEVSGGEGTGGGRTVENGRVRTAADDRPVGGAGTAGAEELGLDLDLELAFGHAGAGKAECREVASRGGIGGGAHEVDLGRVFGAARFGDPFAEMEREILVRFEFEGLPALDAVGARVRGEVGVAQEGKRFSAARLEPGVQFVQRADAVHRGRCGDLVE